MAKINDRGQLKGPLFGPEDDILAVVEEILDRQVPTSVTHKDSQQLVQNLLLLDIARSLRTLADRPQMSCRASYSTRRYGF